MVRRSVIDVGTNSVKLLVADVDGDEVLPVWEGSKQTRLGRGLYDTGLLRQDSLAATAEVAAEFSEKARQLGAVSLRIFATSAAREARNGSELMSAIRAATGVVLEVISGEQEAAWAFSGVATGRGLAGIPLLVLDVGGGSTEFVLGRDRSIEYRQSFPLGSVRLFEHCAPGDNPDAGALARCRSVLRDFLQREVAPSLGPALTRVAPERIIGVGGTTAILAMIRHRQASFDRALIESTVLMTSTVHELIDELWSLPLEERRCIPGLPPERADVILTGAAIYGMILEQFGFADLRISTRGLRFAALQS